ncbi:MAG: hypothetical protein AUG87_08105 [Candidatus Rokubacteria bacterium 13_1_20CM_4_70_14]|nr:MAG: hypothetical protein AUG87_08105 [Candidatus Rokubacteria bacterium 13_1_20CM_4_70_14]
MADRQKRDDQEWALQRRLEDVFAKLGEKFGDLTGRVETQFRPTVTFDDVGGVRQAKAELRGFAVALTNPDLYSRWGIAPPKGLLLYGPPGTGKTKLAQALATASGAIFYHLKLTNLTSKFGVNTGELLQEILRIVTSEGTAVLFLDEAEALSLLDPTLVAPGRLDHLIEIALPDTDDQREILELIRVRTEKNAGRQIFAPIDYDKVLPVMGGMSGADISVILRRTLEAKVHAVAAGTPPSLVTTENVLDAIDGYKGVRGVVEKIRYGQYL